MRVPAALFLAFLLTSRPLFSSVVPTDGLADARAARAMLGPGVWSRLARIENRGARGILGRSPYPKTVYAVVFELSGLLWFYTDADGTQSLSLTRGTAAKDEEDPGPLFRAIDRGFASWSWIEEPRSPAAGDVRSPPNACFIESVAVLLRRIETGEETRQPQLLSYYVRTPERVYGHTVLVYGTPRGLEAIDPGMSPRPVAIPRDVGTAPLDLSGFLRGGRVSSARTLPVVCGQMRPAPSLCEAGSRVRSGAG